jgi:hypothetical protein
LLMRGTQGNECFCFFALVFERRRGTKHLTHLCQQLSVLLCAAV